MTTEAWLLGSVPSHYALRTLGRMDQTIESARSGIENEAAPGIDERTRTLALLRHAQNAAKRARVGIEQLDRSAVEAAVSSFARP
jgi:hypothetical protein